MRSSAKIWRPILPPYFALACRRWSSRPTLLFNFALKRWGGTIPSFFALRRCRRAAHSCSLVCAGPQALGRTGKSSSLLCAQAIKAGGPLFVPLCAVLQAVGRAVHSSALLCTQAPGAGGPLFLPTSRRAAGAGAGGPPFRPIERWAAIAAAGCTLFLPTLRWAASAGVGGQLFVPTLRSGAENRRPTLPPYFALGCGRWGGRPALPPHWVLGCNRRGGRPTPLPYVALARLRKHASREEEQLPPEMQIPRLTSKSWLAWNHMFRQAGGAI